MDTQEYFLEFVGRCKASKEWARAASDMLSAVLGAAREIGPGWHDINGFFANFPEAARNAFWVLLGLALVERQENAVWLSRSSERAQYWRLRTLGGGFCHDQKTGGIGFGDNIAIDNFRQGQGLDEIPSRSSVILSEFRLSISAEEILSSGNPASEIARTISDFSVENCPCFGHILEQKYLGETAPTDEPKKAAVPGQKRRSKLTADLKQRLIENAAKNPNLSLEKLAKISGVSLRTIHNYPELKRCIDSERYGSERQRLEANAKLMDFDDFS